MQTLRVVGSQASPDIGGAGSRASVEIYRPFFLAGMLTMLTAGCTLGAVALVGICMRGSYTATGMTPYVLAHANSQLYGWVGFFIMGFALQMHPPRLSRARLFHWLAYGSLGLMGVGIALRFVSEPLAGSSGTWVRIGTASSVLQLLAVVAFLTNTSVTRHRTGARLEWQTKFVFASLAWLVLVAAAEPLYFAASHGPDAIPVIARWSPILRNTQFLGFVANMIFGVSLVKLGSCFGFAPARGSTGNAAFLLWNLGLLTVAAGWLYRFDRSFDPGTSWLSALGGASLGAGVVCLLISSRVCERVSFHAPAQKFVRGSYTWLGISILLIVLEPLHLQMTGASFSHSYTGAIRHALTVGFISQMILGFGLHVASKMNDIEEAVQPALWATFVLVNLGNAGRVGLEIATDYTPRAFGPMAPTGFIELTGLAIWAYSIGAILLRQRLSRRLSRTSSQITMRC